MTLANDVSFMGPADDVTMLGADPGQELITQTRANATFVATAERHNAVKAAAIVGVLALGLGIFIGKKL